MDRLWGIAHDEDTEALINDHILGLDDGLDSIDTASRRRWRCKRCVLLMSGSHSVFAVY